MIRARAARGLTLLEVVISTGLIVLLVGTMFMFYDVSLKTREAGRKRIETGELARRVACQIAEEIRAANGFVPGLGPGISGLRQEIHLQTLALPDKELFERRSIQEKPLPAECDVREVRYYLGIDLDETETYPAAPGSESGTDAPHTLGIVRREVKTLRQILPLGQRSEEVSLDLVSDRMRYLRFRYFDGVEWVDVWTPLGGGMGNALPQAVEVTVGYAPVAPEDPTEIDLDEADNTVSQPEPYDPDRYTVVVRLPQADVFLGSRIMRASRRALSGMEGGLGSDGGGFGSLTSN